MTLDSELSSIKAAMLDEEDYAALYAIFHDFVSHFNDSSDPEEVLETLSAMRFDHLMKYALDGFGMDYEDALKLLKAHNENLSKGEREKRNILVAAVENLIEFAVAEEYQMIEHLPDTLDEVSEEEFYAVFDRYNKGYAAVENDDVHFAMGVAAVWLTFSDTTALTYMTQGDNKVRPWHMVLEGTSYLKREFPDWLIPPIEHGCRCFLVEEDGTHILNESNKVERVQCKKPIEKPDFVSPVFSESVCKGGRIFGKAHSYFQVQKRDKKRLRALTQKLKKQWLMEE